MRRKRLQWAALAGGACVSLGIVLGCSRDVRLASKDVPTVVVRPVTHYGMALDENASPKQVAYVALRAIRDDFLAADDAERKKALDVQFDVCAADEIQRRNTSSVERDEFVYNVVYRWTPTVSHYVADLPTEWAAADARMRQRQVSGPGKQAKEASPDDSCEIAMVVKDPGGDPKTQVVLLVWLVKDHGLWRVTHLGFDRSARAISGS